MGLRMDIYRHGNCAAVSELTKVLKPLGSPVELSGKARSAATRILSLGRVPSPLCDNGPTPRMSPPGPLLRKGRHPGASVQVAMTRSGLAYNLQTFSIHLQRSV